MSKTDLIKKLISKGESKQLEFKEVLDKIAIAKTACSFLNTEGGQILIGVRDNKSVAGLTNAEAEAKLLSDFLISQVVPESPINVLVEKVGNRKVIVVEVVNGTKQPYVFQGSIYMRKGLRTTIANATDVTSLINNREVANLYWERQIAVGADINDLDQSEIRDTIREIDKTGKGNVNLSGDIIEFLEYYGLYKNGRITNAAMLLFGKEPAKFIPQSRVRITIFKQHKTSSEYLYDKMLESNLFKLVNQIEEFFEINIGSKSTFHSDSWKRQDKRNYPNKALREGVLNALIHRDYSNISGTILIGVYPDRLEIVNTGTLPNDLKPKDLKSNHLSIPRNHDIAHLFFMRGYIEKLGRGTIMIIEETKKMGFKEPIWTSKSWGTTLTFPGITVLTEHGGIDEDDKINVLLYEAIKKGIVNRISDSIKIRLLRIIQIIYQQDHVKAKDILKKLKVSPATLNSDLKLLSTLQMIEYRGSKKIGGYYLTKKIKNKLEKLEKNSTKN